MLHGIANRWIGFIEMSAWHTGLWLPWGEVMARYRYVEQGLGLIRRSGWWNPRVRRIVKAAPLVVVFLLLNARSARSATCSFNPTPDPTVDGSPTSLRRAIRTANASGQDCLITLQAGAYTLTLRNARGHE